MSLRTTYRGTGIDSTLEQQQRNRLTFANNPFELLEEDAPQPEILIPDYMEPIGDSGFFTTPMEPADPTDCARYPESPWCGGPGINFDDVVDAAPMSITPDFQTNSCEACLSLAPTLFWISLPQYKICYRQKRPECQPPEEPPEPPDPPPPPGGDGEFQPAPAPAGRWPGDGCSGYTRYRSYGLNRWTGELIPYDNNFLRGQSNGPLLGIYTRIHEGGWEYAKVGIFTEDGPIEVDDWNFAYSATDAIIGGGPVIDKPGPQILDFIPSDPDCVPGGEPPTKPGPRREPPPPDPPPPRCCMCCNSTQNTDLEELLRLIARRLGTDDYPISTPRWLVTNAGNDNQAHESLTQFNVWLMQQIDALAGQFPVDIEIEDADPTLKGNQKKKVRLPNIAEGMAELYGLAAKTAIDSDIHTAFMMRLAAEVMSTKTAALIAQEYASANASYLGYKGNQRKVKVNFAFNPTETDSLEGILKSTQQTILGWRNEDNETVVEYLQKLMFSAGVIKAVFFRKKSDIERVISELKELMQGEGSPQDESWKEFVREINNPESLINKNAPTKPEIDNLKKERQE